MHLDGDQKGNAKSVRKNHLLQEFLNLKYTKLEDQSYMTSPHVMNDRFSLGATQVDPAYYLF